MPIANNVLHVGKKYRIEFISDQATPGPSLLMRGWVPRPTAAAPPGPLTLFAAPGDGDDDLEQVPASYALDLHWKVPKASTTRVRIRVLEEGAPIVDQFEVSDGSLTVVVIPGATP